MAGTTHEARRSYPWWTWRTRRVMCWRAILNSTARCRNSRSRPFCDFKRRRSRVALRKHYDSTHTVGGWGPRGKRRRVFQFSLSQYTVPTILLSEQNKPGARIARTVLAVVCPSVQACHFFCSESYMIPKFLVLVTSRDDNIPCPPSPSRQRLAPRSLHTAVSRVLQP